MTSKKERTLTIVFAPQVAMGGGHYFLAGKDEINSLTGNVLGGLEIIAGPASAH